MLELLVPVIVFSGFLIGILLAKVSPEEMVPGQVYFIWALRVLGIFVALVLLYFSGFHLPEFMAGLVIGFLVRQYHAALGFAVAGALAFSESALLLVGTSCLLFELVYGTLSRAFRDIGVKKVLFKSVLFFAPFVVLLSGVHSISVAAFGSGMFIAVLLMKSLPSTAQKF